MVSLSELSQWSLKYLFFTSTLFPAKTVLEQWLKHNLTAADLVLMRVCVCVMVRGNSFLRWTRNTNWLFRFSAFKKQQVQFFYFTRLTDIWIPEWNRPAIQRLKDSRIRRLTRLLGVPVSAWFFVYWSSYVGLPVTWPLNPACVQIPAIASV